jgi:hypothetical protein
VLEDAERETGEYERGSRAKFCAGGATESGWGAHALADPEPTGTLRGLEFGPGSRPGELARTATSGNRWLSMAGCD